MLAHLHNVSGGVLAGDRLALEIDVARGAAAQITTTGATRLYRHRAGAFDSEQSTTISVGEAAVLEYLPDPLIPYARARHAQTTEIRLARTATLFWWEVVAPGRQARGERFAFERLRIENSILSETRLLLQENFVMEPGPKPLNAPARLGQYSWLVSFCICQEGRQPAFWRSLEDELNELARRRTRRGEEVWGASMLISDGMIVRGLSSTSRFIHTALIDFWRMARTRLTGEDAVPPRKTY